MCIGRLAATAVGSATLAARALVQMCWLAKGETCAAQDDLELKDPETEAFLAENWPRYNDQETVWGQNVPKQYMQGDWVKLIDGRLVSTMNVIYPDCTGYRI